MKRDIGSTGFHIVFQPSTSYFSFYIHNYLAGLIFTNSNTLDKHPTTEYNITERSNTRTTHFKQRKRKNEICERLFQQGMNRNEADKNKMSYYKRETGGSHK